MKNIKVGDLVTMKSNNEVAEVIKISLASKRIFFARVKEDIVKLSENEVFTVSEIYLETIKDFENLIKETKKINKNILNENEYLKNELRKKEEKIKDYKTAINEVVKDASLYIDRINDLEYKLKYIHLDYFLKE